MTTDHPPANAAAAFLGGFLTLDAVLNTYAATVEDWLTEGTLTAEEREAAEGELAWLRGMAEAESLSKQDADEVLALLLETMLHECGVEVIRTQDEPCRA